LGVLLSFCLFLPPLFFNSVFLIKNFFLQLLILIKLKKFMSNRNFLRFIVTTSIIAGVSLSCFSIFFLSPSFTHQFIKDSESEAVMVGNFLSISFRGMDKVSRNLPDGFVEMAQEAISVFGLRKIKVFAPDGETVYSSSEKDIGFINGGNYFHNIIARGQVFSKLVYRGTKSLENEVMISDVLETYVPIINSGKFVGALEIYYDITVGKGELDELLFKSNFLLLVIAAGLLLAIWIISLIPRRSFFRQAETEKKIIQQSLDLQEKNSELEVLNDVSRVLSKSIDLETLLPLVLETVIDKLPVPNLEKKGGIMLVDGNKLKLVTYLGHDNSFLKLHENISIHDCLCGLAARSGEIVISRNSDTDSRHTICYENMQPHGHIIVPLKSANKVLGVLYFYLAADVELQHLKRNLLESMASQIGMAIDNARLYGETKEMSLHDPLTGLANRRFMDANLQQAITLAERYSKPLCLAMFDIDLFKKYNDKKGHDAGDKQLFMVADKIARSSRDSDLAVRYGGEEFMLIMPETDLSGARMVADRIRQNIADTLEVTISAGVAKYIKGSSAEKLIKSADMAMYKAKENGRNRVEIA
jgi:diguanylate cyclase (GGDEF)-like protein